MATDPDLEFTEKQLFDRSSPDRLAPYLEYWQAHKNDESKGLTFRSGLIQLDAALGGFKTGELIVVTGPTGNGKTLLADSLGQRFLRKESANVAWFSYEVPTLQMIEKYRIAEDSEKLGLYVPLELKAGSFDWLKLKCVEARLKFNCRIAIIDHLHFIVDMNTNHNMSLNIGAVMRQIKREIAVALNMVVFVIAHQGQKKEGAEPSIDNIRDSSFIAQESDTVLVVYRTADPVPPELAANARIPGYPQTFEKGFCAVKIEKARRTGVYRKRLNYQKQDHWLEEV